MDRVVVDVDADPAARKEGAYLRQLSSGKTLPLSRVAQMKSRELLDIASKPHLTSLNTLEWTELAHWFRLQTIRSLDEYGWVGPYLQAFSQMTRLLRDRGGRYAARADLMSAVADFSMSRDERSTRFAEVEPFFAEDAAFWFERGLNEFRAGRFQAADEYLLRAEGLALTLKPQVWQPTLYRARTARWLGRTEVEAEVLVQVLDGPCLSKDVLDEAFQYAGPALLKLGQFQEALALTDRWAAFPHWWVLEMCAVRAAALSGLGRVEQALAFAQSVQTGLQSGLIQVGDAMIAAPRRLDGTPDNRGSLVLSAALSAAGQAFTGLDLLRKALEHEGEVGRDGRPRSGVAQMEEAMERAKEIGQRELVWDFGVRMARLALTERDQSGLVRAQDALLFAGGDDRTLSALLWESTGVFPDVSEFQVQLGLHLVMKAEWRAAAEVLSPAAKRRAPYSAVLLAICEAEQMNVGQLARVAAAVDALVWPDDDGRLPLYVMQPLLSWAERHGEFSAGMAWAALWRPHLYVEPGDRQAYRTVELAGRCALADGAYDDAQFWIGQALEFHITNSTFGYVKPLPFEDTGRLNAFAALAAELRGRPQVARDHLASAVAQTPADPFVMTVQAYFLAAAGQLEDAYQHVMNVSVKDQAWLAMATHLVAVFQAAGLTELAGRLDRRVALQRDDFGTVAALEERLRVTSSQVLAGEESARQLQRVNATILDRVFRGEAAAPALERLRQLLTQEDLAPFEVELDEQLAALGQAAAADGPGRLQEALQACWLRLPEGIQHRVILADQSESLMAVKGGTDFGLPMMCLATGLERLIRLGVERIWREEYRGRVPVQLTLGAAAYLFPESASPELNRMLKRRTEATPRDIQVYVKSNWSSDVGAVSRIRNDWGHGTRTVNEEEYSHFLELMVGTGRRAGLMAVAADVLR